MVSIDKAIVHGIGSKIASEGVRLSKDEVVLTDNIKDTLLSLVENSKLSEASYQFFHESNELDLNPLYVFASRIFAESGTFKDSSFNIAKLLYEKSDHPRIRSGELIVILFDNYLYHGESYKAIGLFKSESRDRFLDLKYQGGSYSLFEKTGLNVHSLDKGAVIIDSNRDSGFIINILMRANGPVDTNYWMNGFLHVRQIDDSFYKTQRVITHTKSYIKNVLKRDDSVSNIEQAEIIARASEYLSSHNSFDDISFRNDVFQDEKLNQGFQHFRAEMEGGDLCLNESFDIDKQLLKKKSKVLNSVIKLDKNFSIYIHGGEGMIKKGFDEVTGMNFYQFFFNNEE